MGLRSYLPITLLVTLATQGLAKVFITSPVEGVAWKPGNTETITWNLASDPNKKGSIKVLLYGGTDMNKIENPIPLDIPKDVDRTAGIVKVKVPTELQKGQTYTIAIVDADGEQSFSHGFDIPGAASPPKESSSKDKKEDKNTESDKPTKTSSTKAKETETATQSSQYSKKTTATDSDSTPTRTRTMASTTRSTMRPTPTVEPEEPETNEDDSAAVRITSFGYSAAVVGLVSFWYQW